MSKTPLEICSYFGQDEMAKYIGYTWDKYHTQRQDKVRMWMELRNYVFATDTTTTSNKSLPWKNSTTIPKLCQIRDNLHSNYISALFPNDDWLKWEGYTPSDATKAKVVAIESYMGNKTREGHFRLETSKLLYDFIDYGNAFATVSYENSYKEDEFGSRTIDFIGPRLQRISPLDIVFNPLASSFKDSFKIVRSLKTLGELKVMAQDEPDNAYLQEAIQKRDIMMDHMARFGWEDAEKAEGICVDGFGSYAEYLQSGYVEILEFFGDYHSQTSCELYRNKIITVIDRMFTIRNVDIPSWLGHAPIYHVGWRLRTDNLYAMGPLENLVGMQYRIDHLENLKADAMDLAVLPPLVIKGDVEEFRWEPGAEIHIDDSGSVEELGRNSQWVIQADNAIQMLEQRMEMYAGAPREAMGIRTAGEKTAFEVQQLQAASGRIFQEKTNHFELELLEKVLNAMLEVAKRNLDQGDVIRVMDDDLGVQDFLSITKEDITASGKLRPIGARHFAAQAQLMQNMTQLFNTPMAQMLAPHTSSKAMAKLVEDVLGLQRYQLFSPNVAIFEQQETQRLVSQAQEDLTAEQSVPPGTL